MCRSYRYTCVTLTVTHVSAGAAEGVLRRRLPVVRAHSLVRGAVAAGGGIDGVGHSAVEEEQRAAHAPPARGCHLPGALQQPHRLLQVGPNRAPRGR
eukprot:7989590-Pyramimonas_sp.AAC.1